MKIVVLHKSVHRFAVPFICAKVAIMMLKCSYMSANVFLNLPMQLLGLGRQY